MEDKMNLDQLLQVMPVRSLDRQFAKFIEDLYPDHPQLSVAALLVSYELGRGNVCLDFSLPHDFVSEQDLQALFRELEDSKQALTDGPLRLDQGNLYLQKYLNYEEQLADSILSRLATTSRDLSGYKSFIRTLFPKVAETPLEIDWQAVAACTSAQHKFSVISGGPGTGKTTTVIRLLALLIEIYRQEFSRTPIIKLAAPTGKAAMRLTESINHAKQKLQVSDSIKDNIPVEAETLHRLLKRNRAGEFSFNRFNPLHLDVLIVDEASMVDLPLMAKLVDALPEHGQLILLGDKDQLASVEAGSVLADICDNEQRHGYGLSQIKGLSALLETDLPDEEIEKNGSPLRNALCHLRKSYRFHEQSGIGHLAKAANKGSYQDWLSVVNGDFSDISAHQLSEDSYKQFIIQVTSEYSQYFAKIDWEGMSDKDAILIHNLFNQFQVLCAVKEGPLGVSGLNQEIEKQLLNTTLKSIKGQEAFTESKTWYGGRPIIILENDYGLNLYNGDIGILLPHKSAEGEMKIKATFVGADGSIRWLQPSRLPKHETVYAMTIHKSQGSEFDHCALVLPDYSAPILSKELIYTGVTRAKSRLTLMYKDAMVSRALSQKVQRASGLGERLWGHKELEASLQPNTATPQKTTDSSGSSDSEQFSLF